MVRTVKSLLQFVIEFCQQFPPFPTRFNRDNQKKERSNTTTTTTTTTTTNNNNNNNNTNHGKNKIFKEETDSKFRLCK